MPAHLKKIILPLFILSPALFSQAQASDIEQQMLRCSVLGDASVRLSCFDALAKAPTPVEAEKPIARAEALQETVAPEQPTETAPEMSRMVQRWELDVASKRGKFVFRPHHDNYLLLANYSNASNDEPFKKFTPAGVKSKHVELTYQLSMKMKLAEEVGSSPVDVWVAYTQQSFWQAYNRSASSPFRETNYQPEVMAMIPINKGIGDLNIRYLNFGLVHQSNGQTSTLSRSWNRIYAELGVEHGNFSFGTRVWRRLDNARSDNDNIDIIDYMGHGDIHATYREKGGREFSLTARRNFNTGHGALQASLAMPITTNLKAYFQIFSGYGQSLIDYNHSQKSIGAGFMVDF